MFKNFTLEPNTIALYMSVIWSVERTQDVCFQQTLFLKVSQQHTSLTWLVGFYITERDI